MLCPQLPQRCTFFFFKFLIYFTPQLLKKSSVKQNIFTYVIDIKYRDTLGTRIRELPKFRQMEKYLGILFVGDTKVAKSS